MLQLFNSGFGGQAKCMSLVETEQPSPLDLSYDYEFPPPRQIDTLGVVLVVALILTPWLLIGLLLWFLA